MLNILKNIWLNNKRRIIILLLAIIISIILISIYVEKESFTLNQYHRSESNKLRHYFTIIGAGIAIVFVLGGLAFYFGFYPDLKKRISFNRDDKQNTNSKDLPEYIKNFGYGRNNYNY